MRDMLLGPRRERCGPVDELDEAPSLVDGHEVDVERDVPLGNNEPVERDAAEEAERPMFDQ
ncbi:hypothetical protein [Bradyrhizobium sp. C9]|uniref:hypothetical protein n=1 Tax=Bradyrhizobium sp. C9 TaxID=142585 RepID=UPI000BE95ABB|nr:hypothetical protein [Bradyrhizobium sp. C9]PDT75003.1 hypothetical protein CO675_22160 [Bradyrhizobium sp. C9]